MQPESISDQDLLNRRWRPALMSFFLRRVHNHAEAEDLTQEVFARLLGSRETPSKSADAYIFQVAGNLLRDRARRGKVRAEYREMVSTDDPGIELLDPYRIAAGREAVTVFAAGLADLPARTREIFTLYRIENVDKQTIADNFGISKSAVKQHVMKAMAFLMARMRESR